jgi:hypothetical protein
VFEVLTERRRVRALVLEWAVLHRAELRQAWDLARRNQKPSKIQPLEWNKGMIRIIRAEPLPQCRLKVTFNDGVSGVFPVEPERRGGVFLKLLDVRVFNAVTVNPDFGCVEWPGGVDLCPDARHQAMTGSEAEGGTPFGSLVRRGESESIRKPGWQENFSHASRREHALTEFRFPTQQFSFWFRPAV